jgi:endonuclease/exonuclease/phosphatase family metal-dependent hydrolase
MEMAEVLNKRNNPMIVLGDFNSDWFAEESVVKQLAQKTKMKVYKPHADNLHTYEKRATRLDWILISDELEFTSYQVIPDVISDHLAVVAEIKLIK